MKVFGIVMLLAALTLVIALAPLADSNSAVTASSFDAGEVIRIPDRNQITPLRGNITDMAVSLDGNTIYVIDSTLNNVVYVSTDGGYNFKQRMVPTGLNSPLRAVAVVPDDSNVVAVVDSKPAGAGATEGGIVWISNNGGWTWSSLPSVPNTTAMPGTFITDIAVGPGLSGTVLGRNYLVCSRDLATGVTGRVHITGTTTEWEDLAPGFPLYPLDFTSCRFSPNYAADRSIATVGSMKGGTFQDIVLTLGTPQSVTHVSFGASPTDTQIVTSDIVLSPDFYAGEDVLRTSFVAWDSSTNKGEDVYRVFDTFVTGLNVPEADKGIRSIAYDGNRLLVGMQATNQVYRTEDPLALSPAWYASIIPPAGDTDVVVGLKTTHTCYAGTSGTKGGFFSISIDNGITFPAPIEPPGTEVTNPAYEFPKPEIRSVRIPTGVEGEFETFDQVSVEGLYNYGEPGEPVLPYNTCRILIPPGHELVSVEISGEKKELPGEYLIEPGQIPIPASNENFTYTPPDPSIYGSTQSFPYLPYRVMSVQHFRGYQILLVNLISIEYVGADKKISYFRNMEVDVKTAPTGEHNPLYRAASADEEQIGNIVDNPESLEEYPPTGGPVPASLPPGECDMVIITNSTLTPTFQDYADWRTDNRGIHTTVYDIATILATYSGYDNAERLRNFIIDAYTNWGIEYVLLGGDVEIVPYRLLRSEAYGGEYIPADIYFAGLDGNWDNDGDHIYGEMSPAEEADLFAEVYIGRAPVNNVTEAQNVCNKIRSYEESNLGSYRCDWLFFTTVLDSSTNGGDGGDYEEHLEALELNPPHGFNITKVYEHLGGTKAQIVSALNTGQRIGSSCGHGSYKSFGQLNRAAVDNLNNTEYCLIYTWACLTNKFEENDAISEHFLHTAHGAFAYIGNSRYGWYYSGDASGTSHEFEREFYDALIDEGIPRVGWALQDSKEEFSGSVSSYSRWVYYELNLMGDPSTLLRIKSDLLIRDHPLDDGTLPSHHALGASPDIAVDQPLNGWQTTSPFIVNESPEYGSVNRVYVRVSNPGCEDTSDVTVRLYRADPAGGMSWPGDWNYIGENNIPTIPAGSEATSPYIEWIPSGTPRPQSLLATVETTDDPISIHSPLWDNNVARLDIAGPGSPDVLLIRDHPLDDGSLPSNAAFWTSPDIAVDQPLNGWQTPSPFIVHENPEHGSVNRVYIRVHNLANEDASDLTVRLYRADPAGGIPWPGDWNYIGESIIPTIPAGGEATAPYIEWIPSGMAIGHQCLLVTVESAGEAISTHDVPWDNNVAQLNVSIADSGKSHATGFVLNPLAQSGKRNLKITLLGAPEGTTAKLIIPRTVDIENVTGATDVKKPASRWSLSCSCSCFPSCEEGNWWRITITSASTYTNTTATISDLDCQDKEEVNLEIVVPDEADTGYEFIIRITEELNGVTIGGIDYVVRF